MEESKALSSESNNEVHDEFTQSRFQGAAYRRAKYSINNSPRMGEMTPTAAFSLSNLLLRLHSYQPTIGFVGEHYRVAARMYIYSDVLGSG